MPQEYAKPLSQALNYKNGFGGIFEARDQIESLSFLNMLSSIRGGF